MVIIKHIISTCEAYYQYPEESTVLYHNYPWVVSSVPMRPIISSHSWLIQFEAKINGLTLWSLMLLLTGTDCKQSKLLIIYLSGIVGTLMIL